MRVVGLILVIALLTLLAAIANLMARNMRQMMALASLLGAALTLIGLWLSYQYNLTSGAVIILMAAAAYLGALLAQRVLARPLAP